MINVMGDSFGAAIVCELSKEELAKPIGGAAADEDVPGNSAGGKQVDLHNNYRAVGDEQV